MGACQKSELSDVTAYALVLYAIYTRRIFEFKNHGSAQVG